MPSHFIRFVAYSQRRAEAKGEFGSAPPSAANMQPEKLNFFPPFPMTYFSSTSDPKLVCKSPSPFFPANKNFGDH
jgi:hypothetical protein